MRNVLLMIAPALLLAACEKKYCWNCELRTTTITVTNTTDTTMVSQTKDEEVCDKTERDINILQNERTEETVIEGHGVTTHKLYIYSCQKK